MSAGDIITFLSDWGREGGYVAACEASIAAVRPQARVVHISHEIPVGDIRAGALTIARVAPFFRPAVHLAVIDPGVGTGRRGVVLTCARGDVLVGPDNGLLIDTAEALGGVVGAWTLDPVRVRSEAGLPVGAISPTFHGRDVFAPAAAMLAGTDDPALFSVQLDPVLLARLPSLLAEMTEGVAVAEVTEIDRFGNVGLALRFADLTPKAARFRVEILGEDLPEWDARMVQTFGELHPGELGIYCDSWGQTGLTLNTASAAQLLSLERRMRVRLTPLDEASRALGSA